MLCVVGRSSSDFSQHTVNVLCVVVGPQVFRLSTWDETQVSDALLKVQAENGPGVSIGRCARKEPCICNFIE